MALVNGQEPRLTSIVEGGRPWNGLFSIHIPLLVSDPLATATGPMGAAGQRGPNMFSSINTEINQINPPTSNLILLRYFSVLNWKGLFRGISSLA